MSIASELSSHKEEITELYTKGLTISALARLYKVNWITMQKRLIEWGMHEKNGNKGARDEKA